MRNRLCQLYGNSLVTEPKQLRNPPSPSWQGELNRVLIQLLYTTYAHSCSMSNLLEKKIKEKKNKRKINIDLAILPSHNKWSPISLVLLLVFVSGWYDYS